MKSRGLAALVMGWLAVFALPAAAKDIASLASTLANAVILPRMAELDTALAAQSARWEAGCQSPGKLRAVYHAAADAWAQAEIFRAGPLSKENRFERVSYWPDPRNAIDKGLKALIEAPDDAELASTRFSSTSVAVQGLPALERILFGADGKREEAASLSPRECAIGTAITRNLADIGATVAQEWRSQAQALAPSGDKAREAAIAALTDLATALRVLEERKLPPLYDIKAAANPHAAEAWRSQRSERDVEINVASLMAAFGAVKPFAPEAAAETAAKLGEAQAALQSKAGANRAITIVAAVNNAKYYAVDVLPGELGIALGFNSLDGD